MRMMSILHVLMVLLASSVEVVYMSVAAMGDTWVTDKMCAPISMNAMMEHINVHLMRCVPTQMVHIPVPAILDLLEMGEPVMTPMSTQIDHTCVQFMPPVLTQLDHTLALVMLGLLAMVIDVVILMNVLLDHITAHLMLLAPTQLAHTFVRAIRGTVLEMGELVKRMTVDLVLETVIHVPLTPRVFTKMVHTTVPVEPVLLTIQMADIAETLMNVTMDLISVPLMLHAPILRAHTPVPAKLASQEMD